MPLESGEYIIEYLKFDQYIGRKFAEDKSLNPKQIVSIPPGVQAPKWQVEKIGDGKYKLSIGGAPTGVENREVYAFLMPDGNPVEEWLIQPFPEGGPEDVYSIFGAGGHCRIFENKPETQVSIALTKDMPDPWRFIRAN
ncbi:hypothetical protein BOTBODRAFT_173862 [Botryobasidium botryosum FD-172 SS1]|uniref:Ricin B lectin domain-containing protein n=1 Tax=Botryobasidium botryosum (strain FD-172 SS1) TaxID=930990 RepID=A0A067MIN3_BOTB1|nr:hypothetical protein BOTBODRAFT_173862 [Botryobasidium botryosum FD-172 SS1]